MKSSKNTYAFSRNSISFNTKQNPEYETFLLKTGRADTYFKSDLSKSMTLHPICHSAGNLRWEVRDHHPKEEPVKDPLRFLLNDQ